MQGPPPRPDNSREGFVEIIDELLAPERDRLAVPTDVVAYYLRLVAFGSSIEPFNAPRPFDGAELAGLVVHGIAVTGAPPPRPTPRPTTRTSAGARATTSPPAAA